MSYVAKRFQHAQAGLTLDADALSRYTDLIEPFGMDENWIDLTGAMAHYESPFAVAEEIRPEDEEGGEA